MGLSKKLNLILFLILLLVQGKGQGESYKKKLSIAGDQPNVIIILTDDQGYGDLACHGNSYIKTPYLDQLYEESMRFTNFHSGTTCAPTRAGLLTGKNCNRIGVWHTIIGRSLLNNKEITLAEILKQSGYATGLFGKWHLGDNYPFRPEDQGFDEVLIHGGGGVGQTPDYWGNDYFDDTYWHNGIPEKFDGYCTDIWFEHAIQFIKNNRERPFFCYLATNAPHSPFRVPFAYKTMYENHEAVPNADFYGMITNIDDNIGKLEKALKEAGVMENTILIFMSDNGTSGGVELDKSGFLAGKGFNAGMRGKKASPYEGGHRVPFFIRWPGKIQGGANVNKLAFYADVVPTLLELCRISLSEKINFDGRSLVPLLQDQPKSWLERIIIVDTQREEWLVKGKQAAVMTDRWRLVHGYELYDMARDPGQKEDVSEQYPEVVAQLQEEYERWWESILPQGEKYQRIVIGSNEENPVILTCHDIHPDRPRPYPAWNQDMVRKNESTTGFWALKAEKPGRYHFSVRRWPEGVEAALQEGLPKGDPIPGDERPPAGVAIPVAHVKFRIGTYQLTKSISKEDESVDFELPLQTEDYELRATLVNQKGDSTSAFYVKCTFQE